MSKQTTPRKTSKTPGKSKTARMSKSSVPAVAGRRDMTRSDAPASRATHPGLDPQMRHEMISQAAYFHAEQRGFAGGGEMDDWLEAERDIERTLKA